MIKLLIYLLVTFQFCVVIANEVTTNDLYLELEQAKNLKYKSPETAELMFENIFQKVNTTNLRDSNFVSELFYYRAANYYKLKEYKQALNYYELSTNNLNNLADSTRNTYRLLRISNCYWRLNQKTKCKVYLDSAIVSYKESFEKKENLLKGYMYNAYGRILMYNGEGKEAEEAYENAIQHFYKYFLTDESIFINYCYSINNLGWVKKNQRKYQEAIVEFERLSSINANKDIYYLNWIISLAEINEFEKAINLNKKYSDYVKNITDPEAKKKGTYHIYNSYGYIYRGMGEYEKAIHYLELSKPYIYNEEKKLIYNDNMSLIYSDSGNIELALLYMHQATQVGFGLPLDSNVLSIPVVKENIEYPTRFQNIIEINVAKAKLLFVMYNQTKEIQYLHASYKYYLILDQLFNQMYSNNLSEASRLVVIREARIAFEGALKVCKLLIEIDGENKNEYLESSLYFIERSKSLLLQEQLKEIEALELLDQESSAEITRINLEVDSLRMAYNKHPEAATFSKLQLKKIEQDNFSYKLKKQNIAFFDKKDEIKKLNISEIRNKVLHKSQCLINFLEGEKEIFAFWINQDSLGLEIIDKPQSYDSLFNLYNDIVRKNDSIASFNTFQSVSHSVFQILFSKIPIQHTEKLIIIPDGKLSTLPFDALIVLKQSQYSNLSNYRNANYLGLNHVLSYDYSLNTLLYSSKESKKGKPFIFGSNYKKYMAKTLHHAEEESEKIHKIMHGTLINELSYSLDSFKTNLEDAILLHFALHAIAIDENPMNSYIMIPTFINNKRDTVKLKVLDLHQLKLDKLLFVYLSACETGNGKLLKGEGVISIARAFKHQGCSNLIMSQWVVNDLVGKKIAVKFYKEIKKGSDIDAALWKGKKDYLKNIESDDKAHPYYWSGINCVGNSNNFYKNANKSIVKSKLLIMFIIGLILSFSIFNHQIRKS